MLTELYNSGKYQQVLDEASKRLVDASTSPVEAMIIAASHLELGHLDRALRICNDLKPVLGSRTDFRVLLASCLRRSGFLKEAEEIYNVALAEQPDNISLLNNYANLLVDMNKLDEAEKILDNIVQSHAGYSDAAVNLDRLRRKRIATALQPKDSVHCDSISDKKSTTTNNGPILSAKMLAQIDPLELAFSIEEVAEDRKHRQTKIRQRSNKPLPTLPQLDNLELLEELLAAAQHALSDKCPEMAIELAAQLLSEPIAYKDGEVYCLLGDAYINLKCYEAAELAYLASIEIQGDTGPSLVNLTSLACARNDLKLARLRLAKCMRFGISKQNETTLVHQIEELENSSKAPKLSKNGFRQDDDTNTDTGASFL